MQQPLVIFCCYAQADKQYLRELKTRLEPLEHRSLISVRADIRPGMSWKQQILDYLKTAHIILLLISADFFVSQYSSNEELVRALVRRIEGGAPVIPIILRPVDWRRTPFSKLQHLPSNAIPVTMWKNQDEAFLDVAEGIINVVKKCLQLPPVPSPIVDTPSLFSLTDILQKPVREVNTSPPKGLQPFPTQLPSNTQLEPPHTPSFPTPIATSSTPLSLRASVKVAKNPLHFGALLRFILLGLV